MPPYGAASAKPAGGGEAMSDDRFKIVARELIRAARDYMDDQPLLEAERAWQYFDGAVDAVPMGFVGHDDQSQPIYEGSKIVVTECRDTLYSMIPELYRIFTASDEAVQFLPKMPEDVDGAEQATHYANHVWTENGGEELINTALLDWGVKFAAIKVWWEVEDLREEEKFAGLDQMAIDQLEADPEIVEIEAEPEVITLYPQQALPMMGGAVALPVQVALYNGRLVRETKQGKICIRLIPQEELLLDGDAQVMEEARIVGQDALRTVDEVVAMGLDRDLVQQHAESGVSTSSNEQVTFARTRESRTGRYGSVTDEALAWVRIVEANVKVDRDGDGKPETYRVIALGSEPEVVDWEEGDEAGYVISSPYETAHKIIGRGIVETMTDLQDIATSLFRRTLDNLARSINPRAMVSDDDQRTWEDLNSWFGGPIRVSRPGAVEWFTVPFTAANAFPLMEYVESRRAQRTGISAAGQGLDPDVLKGQTLEGVHAMVAAPQSRIEYFARRFALGVMKPVFKEVLRLATQYQDRSAVIRLRNKWIEVDPRHWNASMDAAPRVGLGTGTRPERLMGLQMALAKQEQLLAAGSPLVGLEEYKNTLVQMLELVGLRDSGRYIKDLEGPELEAAQQQAQQAAQQAAQQQAQMAIQAQVAVEKAKAEVRGQVDMQKAQLTAQTDQQKAQMGAQADQQQALLRAETDLQRAQLAAQTDAQQAALRAEVEHLQHQLATQRLEMDHRLKLLELGLEERLEREKIAHQSQGGQGDLRENA